LKICSDCLDSLIIPLLGTAVAVFIWMLIICVLFIARFIHMKIN